MNTALVDPNTGRDIISDIELIKEFICLNHSKRPTLYALMAKRANDDERIKDLLFEVVIDEEKRKSYFLNTLIHAWFPVLFILQQGEEPLKEDLKELLISSWTEKERLAFLNYIKSDEEYHAFLQDMV